MSEWKKELIEELNGLREKNKGLEKIVINLEEVVKKSSSELTKTNKKLKKEIDERKRTEELLHISETRNKALLNAIPDLIFLQSKDGVYLDYNVPSSYNFVPENYLYKTMDKVLPPDIAETARNLFKKTLDTGEIKTLEYSLAADGKVNYYEARIVPYGNDYVVSIVRNVTARKKAEKFLEQRLSMEKLVSSISARFINLLPGEVDREIERALKNILKFEGVHRSYIALLSDDNRIVEHIYEAHAKGLKKRFKNLAGQPRRKFSWLLEKLETLKELSIQDTEEMPDEGKEEKEVLKRAGVRSILAIPLILNKKLTGILGFQTEKVKKEWNKEDIRLLKLLGEIFISVLERKKSEEKLKHRLEMEALVSTISNRFINLSIEEIDREIEITLKTILGFEGVDRCYLMFFSEDGKRIEHIYESHSKRVRRKAEEFTGRLLNHASGIMKKLKKFEIINIPCTSEVSPELAKEKEIWQKTDVRSILSIPLALNRKLIGCMGFQTETTETNWKDEDIKLLKLAGEIFINVLQRKVAEKSLTHRLSMEKLVSTISNRFINLTADEMDRNINRALEATGKFVGLDRCYIYLFTDDCKQIKKGYEWHAENLKARLEENTGDSLEHYQWSMNKLKNFEYIYISSLKELPPEAIAEKETWGAKNIKSVLSFPVVIGKVLTGYMGFAFERCERIWREEDIRLTRMICEIFTNAIERKRSDRALREAHNELEKRVKERTSELMFLNRQLSKEIEERKWVETVLRNSESDYRKLSYQFTTLLDAISEPLLLLNPALKVRWKNKFASILFNSDDPDIYVKHCRDLEPSCPCIKSFISGKEEVARFSYKERLFEIKTFPVKEGKEIINVIAMFIYITEKVNIEAETIRISQLASIGELAAGIAHEINNPITGIISWADYLIDEFKKDSPEYDIISRIISEGERIAYIVKSLLSFSRPGDMYRSPIQIADLLYASIYLTTSAMEKEGIKLKMNISSQLPEINAQPQEIQQVFFNLISNARYALNERYTGPDENKVLEVSCHEILINEKLYIQIIFHDKGTGISGDIINKIKNPFFTTKPKRKGTGLGLSISHGIINSHKGRLYFDTVEGEFTKAIIELPAEGE